MERTKSKNFEIKFWKDWLYANAYERQKLVRNLSFIKSLVKLNGLSEKEEELILSSQLNSFFEDLEMAVYQKFLFEKSCG